MKYLALATDYDGTLAWLGTVAPQTLAALRDLASTGRRLILVTGRRIDDLIHVFPEVAIFDRVVAENGPLLYRPQSHETRVLSDPPPVIFVNELRRRGVQPLTVGQVFVATEQPNERAVLDAPQIASARLDWRTVIRDPSVLRALLAEGIKKIKRAANVSVCNRWVNRIFAEMNAGRGNRDANGGDKGGPGMHPFKSSLSAARHFF